MFVGWSSKNDTYWFFKVWFPVPSSFSYFFPPILSPNTRMSKQCIIRVIAGGGASRQVWKGKVGKVHTSSWGSVVRPAADAKGHNSSSDTHSLHMCVGSYNDYKISVIPFTL